MAMIPTYQRRQTVPGATGMQPQSLDTRGLSPFGAIASGAKKASEVSNSILEFLVKKDEDAEILEARSALASAQLDQTVGLMNARIEEGGKGFSVGITGKFDEWASTASDNYRTAKAKDVFAVGAQNLRSELELKAVVKEMEAFNSHRKSLVKNTIDKSTAIVRLDPSLFGEELEKRIRSIEELGLNPAPKIEMIKLASSRLALSAINGIISADPERAKAELKGGKWNEYITGKELDTLLESSDRAISGNDADDLVNQSFRFMQLQLDIINGTATYEDLDNFRRNMSLESSKSAEQFLSLFTKFTSRNKEAVAATDQIQLVTDAFFGEYLLDPTNSKHIDAVDTHYDRVSSLWPPEDAESRTMDYINILGIVPRRVVSTIVSGLNSTEPRNVVYSASLLAKLESSHPEATRQIPQNNIARGINIIQSIENGRSPEEAVKLWDDITKQKNSIISDRKIELKDILKENRQSPESILEQMVGGGWYNEGINPEIPTSLSADYARIRETEFLRTGDIGSANETAKIIVKQNWGVTEVDGSKRFMRHSPELIWGVKGTDNSQWMREQLYHEAALSKERHNLEYPSLQEKQQVPAYSEIAGYEVGENKPRDSQILYSDMDSARLVITVNPRFKTPDGKPVYTIMRKNDLGILENVPGMDKWVPIYSDTRQSREKIKEAAAYNLQNQEEARLKRKKAREVEQIAEDVMTEFQNKRLVQ
tara:strand:- start:691 stop:2823 length:2133 start_codon:yes stop_codon:yes gene_type:complete